MRASPYDMTAYQPPPAPAPAPPCASTSASSVGPAAPAPAAARDSTHVLGLGMSTEPIRVETAEVSEQNIQLQDL